MAIDRQEFINRWGTVVRNGPRGLETVSFQLSGTVQVRGLAAATAKLKAFPEKLRVKLLANAFREGAKIGMKAVRSAAPTGSRPYTKKELKYRVRRNNLSRSINVRVDRRGDVTAFVYLRRRGFYGRFLEYGWRHHSGKNIGGKSWFSKAITPTYDDMTKKVVDQLWQNIDKALTP